MVQNGAKFHADRPTHLGDLTIEIKTTSAVKHKPDPQAIASGRTNRILPPLPLFRQTATGSA